MSVIKVKGGDYTVKFRAFGTDFGKASGTLNGQTLKFGFGLKYKQTVKLGQLGKVELAVDGTKLTVTVFMSVLPVFNQSFDLNEVVAGKDVKIKGFSKNGLTLSDIVLTLAL